MSTPSLRPQIFLGADHRGFKLAEALMVWAKDNDLPIFHLGALSLDSDDDYVDYAVAVANRVRDEIQAQRPAMGIVICGSGVGVDVVANKTIHIRSCLGFSEDQVRRARSDDDVNVLSLGADYIDIGLAKRLVMLFLSTPFNNQEERYSRRLRKIEELSIL